MSVEGGRQTPGQGATDRPTIHGIPPDARVVEGPATPGMVRERAFAADGYWVGVVKTGAGMVSGWQERPDRLHPAGLLLRMRSCRRVGQALALGP